MTYRIKCPSYTKAVSTAVVVGSLYGNADLGKQPFVKIGNDKFIFVANDKKYKNELDLKEFLEKYFKEGKK